MVEEDLPRAEALLAAGRARDALVLLVGLLPANPEDPAVLLLVARCHLMLNEPLSAVSAATAALAQAPGEPQAWMVSSLAFAAAGDPGRAAWHAERVISQWPDLPGGYWALASARLNQARFGGQARAAAARVLEMRPSDPAAHVLAAKTEMYPRWGRPWLAARRRARAHLGRALELDPANAEAMQQTAVLAALGWGFGRGLRGSAQVLRMSPTEQAPLGSVAFIFRRLVQLVHVLIVVAFFGCLFGWLAESAVAMRISAGLSALVLVLLVVHVRLQLGRSAAAHLRAFPRRDWSGTAWVGCLVLAVVLLNVAAWVPSLVPVLGLALILTWIGAALSWVPRRFET